MRYLVALFLLFSLSCFGEAVYSTNSITFSNNVGIRGGMPRRTTIGATHSSGTSQSTIRTSLGSIASNSVVLLEAGSYTNNSAMNWNSIKGKTLRGAGEGQTFYYINVPGGIGFNSDTYSFSGSTDISSGATKGSTSIVLSASAPFSAGDWIQFTAADANFMFSQGGAGRHFKQNAKALTVSGTAVTFDPPLVWDISALTPRVTYAAGGPGLERCSIEDMTIVDLSASQFLIQWQGYECWTSGLGFTNAGDTSIYMYAAIRPEIRSNRIDKVEGFPAQGDGFGIWFIEGASAGLVEDNILVNQGCPIFGEQSVGIALAYNYIKDSRFNSATFQVPDINPCHVPHSMMWLTEGNHFTKFQADNYFGSSSHQILHRNCITGTNFITGFRICIDAQRVSYFWSVVGNILGDDSWTGASGFTFMGATCGESSSSVNKILRGGFPNSGGNTSCTEAGGNELVTWYPSLSYPDVNTTNTMKWHLNYDTANNAIVVDAGNADVALVDSYLHTTKPAYFGFLNFPPYNPTNRTAANLSYTNIPAGYRFEFGTNPPAGGTPAAPAAGRQGGFKRVHLGR